MRDMGIYNPVSTYRLQFNRDFSFNDTERILPYLQLLGIRTIYASPVFRAVSGSTHGYDVTDPLNINPEVGTEKQFNQLTKSAHKAGIGWIQDIVPNHMGFSVENPWIYDLLQKGRHSEWYRFFDLFDNPPDDKSKGKIILPFFGKTLNELIDSHELSVEINYEGFMLRYYENIYPLSFKSYGTILKAGKKAGMPDKVGGYINLKSEDAREKAYSDLWEAYRKEKAVHGYIDQAIIALNSSPVNFNKLMSQQHYLPLYWKETEKWMGYRRFFTINGLICLNMQDKDVFNEYHQKIRKWMEEGSVDGLRADHVDGLYDPTAYLRRLRELCGERTYIVVEKILEKDELLSPSWPVQGTTGYDFLGMVNNLFTNTKAGTLLHSYYRTWKKGSIDFEKVIRK